VRAEATRALVLVDTPAAAERLARLLDDPVETVRRSALRALTEMSTPEALKAFGEVQHVVEDVEGVPDPFVVKRAIQSLTQAPPELLDVDRIETLVTNRYPDVRALGAALLARMASAEGIEKREKVLELLGRQIGDLDMRVRYPAYEGLFRAGRTEVTEKFLRIIPTATQFALHVPIEVLTQVTHDERALAPILER